MDYLDPKKQARHHAVLFTGYILIAIAIVIATLVLVYQAYGFGLGKNGTVIQNGLVFFSSQPSGASISLNGVVNKAKTNSRLILTEGIYQVKLSRDGYRGWERKIELNGGQVEHFDYPFLLPNTLTPQKLRDYSAPPSLMTQSPDRRWLVVQQAGSPGRFEVFDLRNPADPPEVVTLPAGIISPASNETWEAVEWASNNQHFLLRHNFDNKSEYILVSRSDPAGASNLNKTLAINPTKLSLRDKKHDLYYVYDSAGQKLYSASLGAPQLIPELESALAYQSYGSDTLLYATGASAPSGKVLIKLKIGDKSHTIRSLSAGTNYLLDLAEYSNTLYVAAGATSVDRVYVYEDPVGQLNKRALVPSQVLRVPQVNQLSFSASAQFVVAESANYFGVYDIENEAGYNYQTAEVIDPPQTRAQWMDGNRLLYVSSGKLRMFDYDYANKQTLVEARSDYRPAFAPDYKYLYVFAPVPGGTGVQLTQTPLLRPQDL